MNTIEGVGGIGLTHVQTSPLRRPETIPPPTEKEKSAAVVERPHEDDLIPEDDAPQPELSDRPFSLEATIRYASGFSEADIESIFEAKATSEIVPELSPEKQAEAQQILEAFQNGLNLTSLLQIIRGADIATVSRLLSETVSAPVPEAENSSETPV